VKCDAQRRNRFELPHLACRNEQVNLFKLRLRGLQQRNRSKEGRGRDRIMNQDVVPYEDRVIQITPKRAAVGLLAGLGFLTLVTLVGLAVVVWIVCILLLLIVIL
jgi:hypothetical protein